MGQKLEKQSNWSWSLVRYDLFLAQAGKLQSADSRVTTKSLIRLDLSLRERRNKEQALGNSKLHIIENIDMLKCREMYQL